MYSGRTVPHDWPTRATRETYALYAAKPSWHIEEATTLAAGFRPRNPFYLNFQPMEGAPTEPKPRSDAKTWAQLFDGPIGQNISAYARARRVVGWRFPADELYVSPSQFLEFCSKSGIQVPRALTEAVKAVPRRRTSSATRVDTDKTIRRPSAVATREAQYKKSAGPIVAKLKTNGVRVSASQLKVLIEHDARPDRTVKPRTFQGYIDRWKERVAADRKLARLLPQVLRKEAGRPGDDEVEEQKNKMPKEYSAVLWTSLLQRK